jgi:hypothetical protein
MSRAVRFIEKRRVNGFYVGAGAKRKRLFRSAPEGRRAGSQGRMLRVR